MGYIALNYSYDKGIRISLKSLIEEVEYGSTFAMYNTYEEIIPCASDDLRWVEWNAHDGILSVHIDDDFWREEFFFEKFLTIFVFNFLDFGHLKLEHIDIQRSELKNGIQSSVPLKMPRGKYLLGSIFKPYYHLPLKEKEKQAQLMIENGINVLKNDECFFGTKSDMLKEASNMAQIVTGEAYYVPNITSYINDDGFIEQLMNTGVEISMVDFLVTGFRPIYQLKKKFPHLRIWGHRIGYATLQKHVSMQALSILALLSGIDMLHIGTPTVSVLQEKSEMVTELKALKASFLPIFTKTTPEVINALLPIFEDKAIYMACGYFRNKEGYIDWNSVRKWCDCFK